MTLAPNCIWKCLKKIFLAAVSWKPKHIYLYTDIFSYFMKQCLFQYSKQIKHDFCHDFIFFPFHLEIKKQMRWNQKPQNLKIDTWPLRVHFFLIIFSMIVLYCFFNISYNFFFLSQDEDMMYLLFFFSQALFKQF